MIEESKAKGLERAKILHSIVKELERKSYKGRLEYLIVYYQCIIKRYEENIEIFQEITRKLKSLDYEILSLREMPRFFSRLAKYFSILILNYKYKEEKLKKIIKSDVKILEMHENGNLKKEIEEFKTIIGYNSLKDEFDPL